ncbi:hypothetical protein [Kribbella sp. NPDC004536]|uniref:hypothetical protein n=1 Tax=Kribbella sp. NPDC004536 TaxID=3364106 RepID=UPI00367A3DD4
MDYAAYKAAEKRLSEAVMERAITKENAWIEVDRLRTMVPTVEPAADRERAERSLKSIERALSYKAPPMSDEMAAAIRVQSQAFLSKGTPDERIQLLETAMTEISRIADSLEGAEASRVRHLNEPLALDIETIRIHNDPTHPGYRGRTE